VIEHEVGLFAAFTGTIERFTRQQCPPSGEVHLLIEGERHQDSGTGSWQDDRLTESIPRRLSSI
jgi:hypothetical protein